MRELILWFPLFLPAYVWRTSIGPLPTTVLELAFLALAVAVTATHGWILWRDGLRRSKPWHVAMLAWTAATGLAVIVAPDHIAALGLWRAYVLEPLAYGILVFAALDGERSRKTIFRSLILAVLLVTLWAIWQFATNSHIPTPWNTSDLASRRATGPFPFPNALSLFVVPLTVLFLGFLLTPHERPIGRIWLLIGSVAGPVSVVLAKSDGGLIAIAAAAGIALLWNQKTRWKAATAGLIGLLIVLTVPMLRTKAADTLFFREWSGKVRLIMWGETMDMLRDRPVFGAGLGAYPDAIRPYHKATFIEIFQYPHNILLNLWSETGVLGILAFGMICLVWIRQTRASPYLLPLIAILVHGLVDVPYFKNDLAMQFWVLAALANPLAIKKRRR